MKVLVVGSGGREHALAWKIAQSPKLTKLYVAPGNAGISEVAECVDIKADDIQGLLLFAKKEGIDLTVVGPEAPLVAGITDEFERDGLKVFGPSKDAAKLEGSKAFSKIMMNKFGVPTANFDTFKDINEAKHYVIESEMPIVIKADGLAAGKGVILCDTAEEAINALSQMMEEGAFGSAGNKVIIEDLLVGEEVSILALSDGKNIIPLASSQDHKRAYDHDKGPNTGGMGAYSPCPLVMDDAKLKEIVDLAVRPIVEGMAAEGTPYKGVLYAGLMMTESGPMVLEYNCRFGDPEAQVVFPRLKSDLLPILAEIADGNLQSTELEYHDKACLGVVLASGGYPGAYDKGLTIHGIDTANSLEDVVVFHAGTAKDDNKYVNAGGRVLVVAALGENLQGAYAKAYEGIEKINFDGAFYRKDIGKRALEVLK